MEPDLLADFQTKNGRSPAELSVLPELGATLEQTSICGLGQVALSKTSRNVAIYNVTHDRNNKITH